jgi:hypothetical protein
MPERAKAIKVSSLTRDYTSGRRPSQVFRLLYKIKEVI